VFESEVAAESEATVCVLANRRHRVTLDVTRGNTAREQEMGVDIDVGRCRGSRMSKLQKSNLAYVISQIKSNRSSQSADNTILSVNSPFITTLLVSLMKRF
jgi:hypothetical protein